MTQMHHDEGKKPMLNIMLCYFVSVIILKRQNHVWRTDQCFPGVGVGEDVDTNGLRECFGGDGTVLYWIMVVAA